MPTKFLVELFADWIRDESLRKEVLHKELTALREWGADQKQISDLRELDEEKILKRFLEELKDDLGINLQEIIDDWTKTGGGPGSGGSAGSTYDEGGTHVRGVEPNTVLAGDEAYVVVRGHGWTEGVKMAFVPVLQPGESEADLGAEVEGEVLDMSCDIDVWQRATVKVTLPKGRDWRVKATVDDNDVPESTENVLLRAL